MKRKRTLSKRNYPSPSGSLFSPTWSHTVLLFSETLIDGLGILEKPPFPVAFLLEAAWARSGNREWEKSSVHSCCFRAFPAALGWDGGTSIPRGATGVPIPGWPKARKQGKLRRHSPSGGWGQGWAPAAPPQAVPGRHPGLQGDAVGRVCTCCLCSLQGNVLEMPPSAPWTNAL